MKKLATTIFVLASTLAHGAENAKLQVVCYNKDGSGKAAVVDVVGFEAGVLVGVTIDKSDPQNPKFIKSFTADPAGCFIEATTKSTPEISVN